MEEGTQVIYIDTPGIMDARPGERLNKAMVSTAVICWRTPAMLALDSEHKNSLLS